MGITRRSFASSLAGSAAGATVTLWLPGCGGGGSSGGSNSGGPGSSCGASGGDITDNHGHTLTIAKADLDSTTDKTYTLAASVDGHVHQVTFTPAMLAAMKAGAASTANSTVAVASGLYGGTHSHSVSAQVNVSTCP